MAFTTTNVRKSVFGDQYVTLGSFTCSEGDAAGTIVVEGAWVLATFHSQDSSGAIQPTPMRYSLSTTGGLTTITVYNQEGVTTGKFMIVHK